jgi:peptidoglycan/LPS O-acetylase OafA/YrhL
MAIAYAYMSKDTKQKIAWIVLGAVSIYGATVQVIIIVAVLIYLLIFDPKGNELISTVGNWKIFKFFGDTSYSLYLVHLLIMYPMLGYLFEQSWFIGLTGFRRFFAALIIISPVAYGVSFILYFLIERTGIRLGKMTSKRLVRTTSEV